MQLICWWLTFVLYLIIARVTNWLPIEFFQSYAVCAFAFPTSESQIVHYYITVGLLFISPLFIGIFSYFKIYLKTHEHQQNVVSSPQNRSENGAARSSVKEANISRVLLFVAAGFLCCWIPMWALVLWFRFSPETSPRIVVMLSMFYFYLSASVNPFIYAFTNGEFRREFRKLLSCYCRKTRIADNEVIEREE